MGIEPTQDPIGPHTGFEDQGHHQAPITSEIAYFSAYFTYRPDGGIIGHDAIDTFGDTPNTSPKAGAAGSFVGHEPRTEALDGQGQA
jgi:hypothetical protein